MCTMAAYAGKEPAAKVLLRLLKNEEGYGSGHFTGLATVHEGKLYYAKVCGDLAELLKKTDAASLPGNIGIAHSRTPGHPSDEWSHPFISTDKQVAYIANGSNGIFDGTNDYAKIYNRLRSEGESFRTEMPWPLEDKEKRTRLDNGNIIHGSDIMCGNIANRHLKGVDLATAMRQAFTEMPSEITGIAISVLESASVTACRINQPLVWGRNATGSYFATTALAFAEENMEVVSAVPVSVSAKMTMGGLSLVSFDRPLANYNPSFLHAQVVKLIDDAMADGKAHHIQDMIDAIMGLWKSKYINEANMYAYMHAYEMVLAGRYEVVKERVPASLHQHTAPYWKFKLKP